MLEERSDLDTSWMRFGLCTNNPEANPHFFSANEAMVVAVKKLCRTCPAKIACRNYALAANVPFGVFGGTTPSERRAILRAERRMMKDGTD